MSRLVVDTNVLVSAFMWAGPPGRLLHLAASHEINLITSETLIAELHEVLSRPKFEVRLRAIGRTVETFLANYRALAQVVAADPLPERVSIDPDDDAVLACAVAGKADLIITGDNDLLRLKVYENISIWTVAKFLESID